MRKKVIRLLIVGFLLIVNTCLIASENTQNSASNHNHHLYAKAPMATASGKLNGLDKVLIDFELLDHNSNPVKAKDFLGKYVLMGFGFTHCGHICPVMAATMAKVIKQVEKNIVGVFISVDTERDGPAITHQYAASFGENMLGLGGDYKQIAAAANNFKVSFAVTKTQRNYTVQHTSNIYVIDPEGKLAGLFALNATPSEILKVIN